MNKELIREVINKYATIRGRYIRVIENEPQYCVIGGLLLEAGYDVRKLHGTAWNGKGIYNSYFNDISDKLMKKYGLRNSDLCNLQAINDMYKTIPERRKNLLKWLREHD